MLQLSDNFGGNIYFAGDGTTIPETGVARVLEFVLYFEGFGFLNENFFRGPMKAKINRLKVHLIHILKNQNKIKIKILS